MKTWLIVRDMFEQYFYRADHLIRTGVGYQRVVIPQGKNVTKGIMIQRLAIIKEQFEAQAYLKYKSV